MIFADAIVQAPDVDRGRGQAALRAGVLLGIAAAEAWLLAHALAAPAALWTTSRAMNAAMLRHWRAGLPALSVAGAATLAGWLVPAMAAGPIMSPATLLVVRLGVLTAAYGLGAWLLIGPSVRDALRVAGVGQRRAALA